MKNNTNIKKYKLLSPIYDFLMGNRIFRNARIRAFSLIDIKPQNKVLLVGVGTGEDIPLLPNNIEIIGIDISNEMLEKARKKTNHVVLLNMDAESLKFENEKFDFVILNLVLSVVENPQKALLEATRVLSPSGTIVVFDKFLDENKKPNMLRKALNKITSILGTDINRRFDEILRSTPLNIIHQESSVLHGNYKIIMLEKLARSDIL
ncbi:SAM-dependent methyltransferase [Paenibacillus selenitireducens]|uniref:SAM-dependent methyltransferase n=1 Tax=Paenibacillus selenitireducens TaxID=1324314 RepID=A0A1T2X1X8_9BACL|nr:methyltransferase domain-containing protein [Paenibacillus selenitireducens]OPA73837.1 SAM-dependent methyltransferase [Paenibacillus selenitireducens]